MSVQLDFGGWFRLSCSFDVAVGRHRHHISLGRHPGQNLIIVLVSSGHHLGRYPLGSWQEFDSCWFLKGECSLRVSER